MMLLRCGTCLLPFDEEKLGRVTWDNGREEFVCKDCSKTHPVFRTDITSADWHRIHLELKPGSLVVGPK
jgi:hypothetical protein